jgi:uncharacterized protein
MLLDLARIQAPRQRFDFNWPAGTLDTKDDEFNVVEPISLQLEVQKQSTEQFRLVGQAKTTLEVECSRCAEPFRIPVDVPFDLVYLPQAENAGEGERAIGEEDLSTSYYHGDAIDLGDLLREQLYLALPMKPLCSEDCRGLCPECGTNLNRGTCDCKPSWEDPRLAGLKALLDDEHKKHIH